MVSESVKKKVFEWIESQLFFDVIDNDKVILRKFLRGFLRFQELDSYAIDYKDDVFRVALVKGKEEYIFTVSSGMDGEAVVSK